MLTPAILELIHANERLQADLDALRKALSGRARFLENEQLKAEIAQLREEKRSHWAYGNSELRTYDGKR